MYLAMGACGLNRENLVGLPRRRRLFLCGSWNPAAVGWHGLEPWCMMVAENRKNVLL